MHLAQRARRSPSLAAAPRSPEASPVAALAWRIGTNKGMLLHRQPAAPPPAPGRSLCLQPLPPPKAASQRLFRVALAPGARRLCRRRRGAGARRAQRPLALLQLAQVVLHDFLRAGHALGVEQRCSRRCLVGSQLQSGSTPRAAWEARRHGGSVAAAGLRGCSLPCGRPLPSHHMAQLACPPHAPPQCRTHSRSNLPRRSRRRGRPRAACTPRQRLRWRPGGARPRQRWRLHPRRTPPAPPPGPPRCLERPAGCRA